MEYQTKIDEIIQFLSRFRIIMESHVTAVYVHDYFSQVPEDWYEDLENWSFTEILNVQQNLGKVRKI